MPACDNSIAEGKLDGVIVSQLPDALLPVPGPAGLLQRLADLDLLGGDALVDDLVGGKRGCGGSRARSSTMISTVLSRFFRPGS